MQESCLKKLGNSEPNKIFIAGSLLGLVVFCLISLITIFKTLSHKLSMLTLFMTVIVAVPHSFSWYLIQHSSTYHAVTVLLILLVADT